ncbi:enoyl-CoA hydratase-related protein [Ferrimonas pelagia]|uniref:Enoyl-CoA hydratase-related protein n=1 Tax=Ferrimonas pelagia TaxID=1177826 RepID=A0ABP9EG14_9GAMM
MNYHSIKVQQQDRIARLTLARSDKHNAFDAQMISELNQALQHLAAQPELSLLVLRAEGKHFCAGADLDWMKRQAQMSEAENLADANELARMLDRLNTFPTPVLACVQGAAFGGALGLVACADIVLAQRNCRFCLSEVKLGLIPATISPYVGRAIGLRQLRRYALSAETIDADTAQRLGLVHQLCDDLSDAERTMISQLQANGPAALRAGKDLLLSIDPHTGDPAQQQDTARRIAQIRVTAEAQEGLTAFFQQRPPAWRSPSHEQGEPS